MNRSTTILASLALATLPVPALTAQALAEGYSSTVLDLPTGSGNVLALGAGATVYFSGTALTLDPGNGGATRDLLSFPSSVFGSFTIPFGRDAVIFGESSGGEVWFVPLALGGSPRLLTTLTFNYDAVALTTSTVLVSAKTGGFSSPDNDLWAVDVVTGQADLVAQVPGSSGPLTRRVDGRHVYYATSSASFPSPPGSTSIIRFRIADLLAARTTGQVLGETDAELIQSGLDAAGALAIDADGDLFGTDFINARVFEVNRGTGIVTTVTDMLNYTSGQPSAGNVQLAPSRDGRNVAFEPFHPAAAEQLLVHESSFSTGASRLRRIATQRATLTVTPGDRVPPGPFQIALGEATASGTAILTLAFRTAGQPVPFRVQGFEQSLFWLPSQFGAFAVLPMATDAQGAATWSLTAPAVVAPLALSAAAAFVSADTRVLGTTPAAAFTIR